MSTSINAVAANLRQQTTGGGALGKKLGVHSSAQRGGGADSSSGRPRPLHTPVSLSAKRSAGVKTGQTGSKPAGVAVAPSKAWDRAENHNAAGDFIPTINEAQEPTSVVVRELRPKQVLAATFLVQGRQGKEVAKAVNVSEETISRWRHRPEFQELMHELIRQHIDSVQLGMISLTVEAVSQLHNLLNAFSDQTSLKACALVLNRVGPILGILNADLRRPMAQRDTAQ